MSYQVLARKWRPNKFEEVVGQQHVLQALSNALTHQRLHHAYLLTGTRGVGKTTIARILSKSLNCTQGISASPCGECEACVQIEEGRFVDLMEIDAASRTKVEDTREILDNVQYRPTSGRYKVYLIDEVHMLSRHSFNALLKTLEEPPPHVIFLLATTDPDKLPVTVLSRCLQFNLRSLTREEISGQLATILQQESISFDEPALGLLARAAQGSMRDALSLTDQAIAQGNNEVRTASVEQMLGRIDPQNMLALLSAIASGEVDSSLDQLRGLVDKMPDIGDALTEMQNILHQVALAQAAPAYLDSELVEHKEAFTALCNQLSPEEVQVYYRIVLEGRRELPFAPDAFAGVEMTILRLLSFRPAGMAGVSESKANAAEASPDTEKKNDDLNIAEGASPEGLSGENDPPDNNSTEKNPTESHLSEEALPDGHAPESEGSTGGRSSQGYSSDIAESATESATDDPIQGANKSTTEDVAKSGARDATRDITDQETHGSDDSAPAPKEIVNEHGSSDGSSDNSPDDKSIAELMAMRNSMSQKLANNDFTPIDTPVEDKAQTKSESSPEPEPEPEPEPRANYTSDKGVDADPAQAFDQAVHQQSSIKAEKDSSVETVQSQAGTSDSHHAKPSNSEAEGREANVEPGAEAKSDANGEVKTAAEIDSWAAAIDGLHLGGRVRQVLLNSNLNRTEQGYELVIDAEQRALCNDRLMQQLQQDLNTLVKDNPLQITFGEPEGTPLQIQQQIDENRLAAATQKLEAHEGFQKLREALGASVQNIKPD